MAKKNWKVQLRMEIPSNRDGFTLLFESNKQNLLAKEESEFRATMDRTLRRFEEIFEIDRPPVQQIKGSGIWISEFRYKLKDSHQINSGEMSAIRAMFEKVDMLMSLSTPLIEGDQ